VATAPSFWWLLFLFPAFSAVPRPRQLQPLAHVRFYENVELAKSRDQRIPRWLCAYNRKNDWLRPAALGGHRATTFDGWRWSTWIAAHKIVHGRCWLIQAGIRAENSYTRSRNDLHRHLDQATDAISFGQSHLLKEISTAKTNNSFKRDSRPYFPGFTDTLLTLSRLLGHPVCGLFALASAERREAPRCFERTITDIIRSEPAAPSLDPRIPGACQRDHEKPRLP